MAWRVRQALWQARSIGVCRDGGHFQDGMAFLKIGILPEDHAASDTTNRTMFVFVMAERTGTCQIGTEKRHDVTCVA